MESCLQLKNSVLGWSGRQRRKKNVRDEKEITKTFWTIQRWRHRGGIYIYTCFPGPQTTARMPWEDSDTIHWPGTVQDIATKSQSGSKACPAWDTASAWYCALDCPRSAVQMLPARLAPTSSSQRVATCGISLGQLLYRVYCLDITCSGLGLASAVKYHLRPLPGSVCIHLQLSEGTIPVFSQLLLASFLPNIRICCTREWK